MRRHGPRKSGILADSASGRIDCSNQGVPLRQAGNAVGQVRPEAWLPTSGPLSLNRRSHELAPVGRIGRHREQLLAQLEALMGEDLD